MSEQALDLKQVTEEQIQKDEQRLNELYAKQKEGKAFDEAEEKEFKELDSKGKIYAQKRIDKLTARANREREAREQLERELEELRAEKARNTEPNRPVVSKETVTIGNQSFYTDDTLVKMIESGEIDEKRAYAHQQERLKEEAAEKAYQRIKQEEKANEEKEVRTKDARELLSKYPQFDKNHPDHDPNDPLFKTAMELWDEGYRYNPRGLTLAVKKAEKMLGLDKKIHIDATQDLSFEANEPPARSHRRSETVSLSEEEKADGVRIWTRGDVINPKTGRPYTEAEAIEKTLNAKKNRIERQKARGGN